MNKRRDIIARINAFRTAAGHSALTAQQERESINTLRVWLCQSSTGVF